MSGLYPSYDDPQFNLKIHAKKEFNDFQYNINITSDIDTEFDKICNSDFELTNHQLFVKNFLSSNTPYNSLLLYHGLGSGKTCSAINMAEEVRKGFKQIGFKKRIIIVASPNVQDNFKLQLFDPNKLTNNNNTWSMPNSCIGNTIINELFPSNKSDSITKDTIINSVNRFINTTYLFMGYIEFANYIKKLIQKETLDEFNSINYLKNEFNNRLIIIDEIHNMKNTNDKLSTYVAKQFKILVEKVKYLKLIFLTATPMFNNHEEIIWMLNLMHLNDNRPEIKQNTIFNDSGEFKIDPDTGEEIGIERFIEISRGYISYVRGENPYSFPFRIFPHLHTPSLSYITNFLDKYPKYSPTNKQIYSKYIIKYTDLYLNFIDADSFQYDVYKSLKSKYINEEQNLLKYDQISPIIQGLNFSFPTDDVRNSSSLFGSNGLLRLMNNFNNKFSYKPATLKQFGNFFHPDNIQQYSHKLKSLYNSIINSAGIILIYSQFIEGGLIPIALMLEEMGYTKYNNNSLLNKKEKSTIKTNKYIIISGNQKYSPDNESEINIATNNDNLDGDIIKVILISKAGSEGIDFKNIRQIHILEPWYNLNRIEQIIGRGVRMCSHKLLPFQKRNVSIYMHCSILPDFNEESVDLYLYRLAEQKAIKIAKIARLLKQNSVDCMLNFKQINLTEQDISTKLNIILSNFNTIHYQIGDKKHSLFCDFYQDCKYNCINNSNWKNPIANTDIDYSTFNYTYLDNNSHIIIDKIKHYFAHNNIVITFDKLYEYLNKYSIMLIQYSLNKIITDKMPIYNTNNIPGVLVIFGEFIIFQPNNLHNKISMFDRIHPLHYKHDTINFHFTTNFSKTPQKDTTNKNYKDILQNIYTNFEIIFNSQLTETPSEYINIIKKAYTKNEWHYLANRIIQHLIFLDYDIIILKKIIIHHYIDFLSTDDKLILINYVYTYTNTDSSFPKEFISLIFDYFNSNSFSFPYNDLDYKAIFFQDKNNNLLLYILKDNTWNIATPTEISFYREKLSYHIIDLKNSISNSNNHFIGFIEFDPKKKLLKFLNISAKKDRGFRCDQANIKKIYEVLDELTSTIKIDINFLKNKDINNNKLKINDICVSSEIFMRFCQFNRFNNNIWFINSVSHLTVQLFLKNIK
jgi:hypothetical protein